MVGRAEEFAAEAALETERRFVLSLGGYSLEVAGARLVTHERLPVPRFNFVQEIEVGDGRLTAFFERTLDHYFQRALRPTLRAPIPTPAYLDRTLRRLGFAPTPQELVLLHQGAGRAPRALPSLEVRPARDDEIEEVAAFWTAERERPELRAAIEVARHHPNPHEALVPVLAVQGGRALAAALVYRFRGSAGIFGVSTVPEARGRGVASDLTQWIVSRDVAGARVDYSIFAESPRLVRRLRALGFRPLRSFRVYALDAERPLTMPDPGPPTPPRWRPSRRPAASRRS